MGPTVEYQNSFCMYSQVFIEGYDRRKDSLSGEFMQRTLAIHLFNVVFGTNVPS